MLNVNYAVQEPYCNTYMQLINKRHSVHQLYNIMQIVRHVFRKASNLVEYYILT